MFYEILKMPWFLGTIMMLEYSAMDILENGKTFYNSFLKINVGTV